MIYFKLLPKELKEILVSKLDYGSIINFIQIIDLNSINYKIVLKLAHPEIYELYDNINLLEYLNVVSDLKNKLINFNDFKHIIIKTNNIYDFTHDIKNINNIIYDIIEEQYEDIVEITKDINGDIIESESNLDNVNDVIPRILFIKNHNKYPNNLYINKNITLYEKNIITDYDKFIDNSNGQSIICFKNPHWNINAITHNILKRLGYIEEKLNTPVEFGTFTSNGLSVLYLSYVL